jgi:oligosaccharide repeat unit polymerase
LVSVIPPIASAIALGGLIVALGDFLVFPALYLAACLSCLVLAIRRGAFGAEGLFGVPWFLLAFAASLQLTPYQTAWTRETQWAVLIGPLVLILIATAGTRANRESLRGWVSETIAADRGIGAALLLLIVGAFGFVVKVKLLGAIPLFSKEIDVVRAGGHGLVPAWVTFLTDCLYLGAWIALWTAYRGQATTAQRRILNCIAAAGIGATALHGSRNSLLFAIAVPVLFLAMTRSSKAGSARLVVVVLIALLFMGTAFVYRTSQHRDDAFGQYFYSGALATNSTAGKLFYALYITGTYPFETLNREDRFFATSPRGHGAYSAIGYSGYLQGVVPKRSLYDVSRTLTRPFYFNVATYEGSLIADFGLVGVVLGSAALGFLVRRVRLRLLRAPSDFAVMLYAYALYLCAFLIYENLLFFYPFQPWDIAVLAVAVRWVRT